MRSAFDHLNGSFGSRSTLKFGLRMCGQIHSRKLGACCLHYIFRLTSRNSIYLLSGSTSIRIAWLFSGQETTLIAWQVHTLFSSLFLPSYYIYLVSILFKSLLCVTFLQGFMVNFFLNLCSYISNSAIVRPFATGLLNHGTKLL